MAMRICIILMILVGNISISTAQEANIETMKASQMMTKTVKIAAVQINGNWIWGHPNNPDQDPADLAVPYIERAAYEGADLVCFPELYLGLFRVPSVETEKIAAAARKHKINVTIGCFEVTDEEGHFGNSILIFNREGEIIGRYFKAFQAVGGPPYLWPPLEDDPEWLMEPGQEFPVFDLDFGRVGILTCYDGYFPEIFRILSLKGAEIILWPNARGGEVEEYIVRTNLQQNYVHMVTINKAVGGGTMIAEWPYSIRAESKPAEEDFVIAELNLSHLREARINAREFHQRRAEIFKELSLDFKVWEQYGEKHPVGLDVPPPSEEARKRILNGSNVEYSEPAN